MLPCQWRASGVDRAFSSERNGADSRPIAAGSLLWLLAICAPGAAAESIPDILIASPIGNGSYVAAQSVNLEGSAWDLEDGDLSSRIQWASDRSGALGTGSSLTVNSLTPGRHIITARVVDSASNVASSARIIVVRPTLDDVAPDASPTVASADAYTDNRASGRAANHGNLQNILVDGANARHTAYLRFDGASGTASPSDQARLKLHIINVIRPGTIGVHLTLEPWREQAIRANNAPAYDTTPWITFTVGESDEGGEIEVELASLARYWHYNPGRNYGLVLRGAGDVRVVFGARERASNPQMPTLWTRAP